MIPKPGGSLMTKSLAFALIPFSLVLLAGCQGGGSSSAPQVTPKPAETGTANPEVKAALDKLSPEDRKLAEEQKTCPITGEALGSMGVPPKLTLKNQTVFLCCASCKKKAEADLDKTLKAVADAKAKSSGK